ncbi:MAG TPA: segregation/condensation protein A [Candidatus Acidoferrales bacterium]|jgi:segregation and condensation protein A|nr:segregation/condensation protein A [Candidatus Acidoferrales bacterium]
MASPYRINLPVYEGPLDLLLDLIRKQEMDIHNIPIAKITEQYLDYLHQIEKLDIDVSADFIYMAATLIHIKSKMLLPVDPLLAGEEQQDPRNELVHRLLEHEKFKNAAQLLYQKQQVEDHVWSHPDKSLYGGDEVQGELVVSLVDLVKTFQQVLERRKEVPKFELKHDQVSIAQMMDRLRQRLVVTDEPISLIEFFETCETKNAMIVALLAVLEMVRMQAVLLVQSDLFEDIRLRKHKMFDAVFAGPDAMSQIEEQYL